MSSLPFFLAISTTDKPVNRSIQAYTVTQRNVFALRGIMFRDIHKKQGRSSSNSGYEIPKICGWKIFSARAPLACKYTNLIFESKYGTTSMKIVNYIERHNFC